MNTTENDKMCKHEIQLSPKDYFAGSDTPLVSIVVPTYNRGSRIADTLDSILSQTYENIEIWVIDDGSNDNTEEVVTDYILKNSCEGKLFYIKQLNSGASAARNNGLRHCKGHFVIFFDSDDFMLPDRVEKQVMRTLIDQTDACSAGFEVRCNGRKIKDMQNYRWYDMSDLDSFFAFYSHGRGILGGTQAWMFSRKIIRAIGGYDERLIKNEDLDLTFRVLTYPSVRVSILDEVLTIFNDDDRKDRIMKSIWNSDKAVESTEVFFYKIFTENKVTSSPFTFRLASFFYFRSFISDAYKLKGFMWTMQRYLKYNKISLEMSKMSTLLSRMYGLFYFLSGMAKAILK